MFSMLSALFGNGRDQDEYSKRFELSFKERMEFEIKRAEAITKVLCFLQEHSLNIEVG
jgi:hypothetical protein